MLPDIHPVDAKGNDELAELAGAFNSMQNTLVDVANEQVEVLRRGVSDIFVTMARRNRSLIDRQLAMLDEFEAEVDDHAVLANYYQLDHLSTRMRRNSESLLVLAGSEPKRRRVKATEIDDVVRASIGEVEDYRRVEVEHLESLQVRGNVVADISHLIAELLDNATAFSPPESAVRVGGRRAGDTYLLRVVDSGIGIPTDRLHELNELLREPPIVGLSVESTLGMSVVSILANKHGIGVELSAGNPGLTVDISLPSSLFGPIDDPSERPITNTVAGVAATAVEDPIVAWDHPAPDGALVDEAFEPTPEVAPPERQPEPAFAQEQPDESPVAASDWTRTAVDLSAFQSGQRSATNEKAASQPEPTLEPAADDAPSLEPVPADEADEQFTPALSFPDSITDSTDSTDEADEADEADEQFTPALSFPDSITDSTDSTDEQFTPALPLPDSMPDSMPDLDARGGGRHGGRTRPADPADPADPAQTSTSSGDQFGIVESGAPQPGAALCCGSRPRRVRSTARPAAQRRRPEPWPGDTRVGTTGATAVGTDHSRPAQPADPQPGPRARRARSPGRHRLDIASDTDFDPDPDPNPDAWTDGTTPDAPDVASALEAALAAFDNRGNGPDSPTGTNGTNATNGLLPTRTRVGDPVEQIEEPMATAQSRLDPDALRERLRAFQTEFRSAGDPAPDMDNDHPSDLGGDRR